MPRGIIWLGCSYRKTEQTKSAPKLSSDSTRESTQNPLFEGALFCISCYELGFWRSFSSARAQISEGLGACPLQDTPKSSLSVTKIVYAS